MISDVLPNSHDAEKALLSSFLIDPRQVGRLCAERRIHPSHFYAPGHVIIFTTLFAMWAKEQPIDFILLTQALKDAGQIEQCGGAFYVTDLFTFLPTAENAVRYAEILGEKLILRQIITTCHEFGGRGFTEQDGVPSLVGEIQERITAITNEVGDKAIPSMKDNVIEAISFLEGRLGDCKDILHTGLEGIDRDLGPMERGNLLVISGKTKSGKSILAGQIALNLALDNQPVLFISNEMSERELTLRQLSSLGRIDMRRVREWTGAEYDRLGVAKSTLARAPMHIATYRNSISEIVGVSQQFYSRYAATHTPLAAVVLDYAQLCYSGTKKRNDDRRSLEIAEISRTCKRLAGNLNVLFILLSQLNDDGRTLESRGIENDANAMVEVGHDPESGWRGVKVKLARSAPMGQLLPIRIIPEHTRAEDGELEPQEPPNNASKRPQTRNSRRSPGVRFSEA